MKEEGKHYYSRRSGIVILCDYVNPKNERIFSGTVIVGNSSNKVGIYSDTWLSSRFSEVKEGELEERKAINQIKGLGF